MKRSDCISSVTSPFSDTSRFQKLDFDPTTARLSTLQAYLNTLFRQGEISALELDFLKPAAAHFGRAHGLPKIHKKYDKLPQFRPIIDTTGTPHYNRGKFISKLLNPFTQNEYSLSDSFQAVSDIQHWPIH